MMPIDPRRMFRNRIDLLKKTIWGGSPYGNPDEKKYYKDAFGTLHLIEPKKPSRYALRKNTKRARKYANVHRAMAS